MQSDPGKPIPYTDVDTAAVVLSLRSPCTRPCRVLTPYRSEPTASDGVELEFPSGEPVVSPGDGTVVRVSYDRGGYVVIDHGHDVSTTVTGLVGISVVAGQVVTRGQSIGMPSNVVFRLLHRQQAYDPSASNANFAAQDGYLVSGEGGSIPSAPDVLPKSGRYYESTVETATLGGMTIFPGGTIQT